MDSPDWWLRVALVVTPVFLMAAVAIAVGVWANSRQDEHLPPAE